MTAFSSPRDFLDFQAEVSRRRRYLRSPSGDRFLQAVADTCKARLRTIEAGAEFWRAQVGHEWTMDADRVRQVSGPYPETRMRPWQDRAYEGRVNCKGIPCLYLAKTREVAMSEVRPWLGSIVSVARFKVDRPVTVVDCSVLHGAAMEPEGARDLEEVVWAHIDHAFSRPVTRSDNTAEYAATQILAEVFKAEGYDGIIYKSAFSGDGYNIALFDIESAFQTDSFVFEVTNSIFEFRELKLE